MKKTLLNLLKLLIILIFLSSVFSFIGNGFNPNRTYIFGFKSTIIVSESMLPSIEVGDCLIIKKTNFEDLKEGDIIAYEKKLDKKAIVVVHRIIDINGNEIITKGDNNQKPDEPIVKSQLVGKIIHKF